MDTNPPTPDDEAKLDPYAVYERSYDPEWRSNQGRQRRKAQKRKPKQTVTAVLATLAEETVGLRSLTPTPLSAAERGVGVRLASCVVLIV